MCAKIIGQIPDTGQYLLGNDEFSTDTDEIPPKNAAARIFSADQNVILESKAFHRITARIPRFTDYDGDNTVDDLISKSDSDVDVRGPPIDETPRTVQLRPETESESESHSR